MEQRVRNRELMETIGMMRSLFRDRITVIDKLGERCKNLPL